LSACRIVRRIPSGTHGDHAAKEAIMVILTIIVALALFSLISFAASIEEDHDRGRTPEETLFLMRFSNH
jgi:hypothetical protein